MTKKQKKSLTRIIIAALLMIILKFLPAEGWLRFVLYMIPYLVVGYDILRKAFKGILNKQVFDENFLMAVATIGAIALGNYTEGVAVMLFYQIGELFQSYAVGKSRRNISESDGYPARIMRILKKTESWNRWIRMKWKLELSLSFSREKKFRSMV